MTEKRLIKALKRQKTDRPPFWLMRQAGRYLPEYRDLRAKAGGFLEMAYTPDYACEITLQPIRRFGMDAAIIFSDILVIPHALGQDLTFVNGEGPKLGAFDFSSLCYDHFDQTLAPVYAALTQTSAALTREGFSETALIGFAGAPWTVATYMIEGGGSKEFVKVKTMAYTQPEKFSALIDLLVEATSRYLIAQIKAGAEAVQLFDSWAGALDYAGFARWVVTPNAQIVQNIRRVYPDIPIIGFPRAVGINTVKFAQTTGVNAIGLDSGIPPLWAKDTLQPHVTVQGNLDPLCLLAGGKMLEDTARDILNTLSTGPFVFNLGHGVHKDTPPEHVARLAQIIKEHQS